ncbi:beta-phosphoglucomutase family hydrolase [Spiroplasma endosymbiont of Aspidapion aeneum]|uniref:beta-phosphoglucomutase family hydrolase n=1 Tax=Spiroplasma endosymbiont of Aspidapion aeneum TaxID=3066276 RepID=UPI00313E6EF6
MSKPKLFIFDCDGVISETAELHYLAWKKMMKIFNVDLPFLYLDKFRGVSRPECLQILKKEFSEINFDVYNDDYLLNYKNSAYLEEINNGKAKIYYNTINIIKKARKDNILIGLASISRNSKLILKNVKILKYFDYVVNPKLIKNSKPDPEIFLKVALELNILPTDCIAFEDALVGVQSIKSAGMFCVGIGDKNYLNMAEIVFATPENMNYDQIINLFNNINK